MSPSPSPSPEDSSAGRVMVKQYLAPYRMGPGDVLSVTLTGLNDPTGSEEIRARIDDKGSVDLPLVGEVTVVDLTVAEVEDAIKAAYVPAYAKQLAVNVEVVSYYLTSVIVAGAVQSPGMVQLRGTERDMLHAVVAAGGISSLSSGEVTLQRLRRPSQLVTYDLSDVRQLEAALAMEPLEDGDRLVVSAAMPNRVFVGGLVNNPSPQDYPPGVRLSVLQALAGAGGLRTDVTPREGTLIRRGADGEEVHVKLDLDKIRAGEDDNILLAAGDILWVPYTAETRVQEFFNQNFFMRAGVSATASYNASATEYMNSNAKRQGLRGTQSGTLQDSFDPFGFFLQNQALNTIQAQP